ncbi:cilia- and flagella-associated protein 54-like [Stegostoma tigrinum]|uniref:cilia- and flagella-associated protein 54-like n=1 Tax=Stegostoma tigrinum TaxID=3053191 RepID=UPI002870874C|nr:cilia- and flagella-associated protein 54-like [Stegostoma tigrinum]
MEPLPASFYGKFDEKNPVVCSLEQKLILFMRDMERVTSYRSYRRGANELFCIWNEYEKLIPVRYYQEKLLKIGSFLVQLKFYKLASWQCFGRYLQQFGSFRIDDVTDINAFKTIFLPSPFETESASLTLHALQMNCICSYHMVKEADSRLLKPDSQRNCTSILKFLRLTMQVALPKEQLCWLIYNGTTYIYTICRHLMVLTLYTKAFEFLLWASICMETSIPLSTVRYLRWRATLYTAVCQCYYDCASELTAEVFARRALGKISELSQLEAMNPSPQTPEVGKAFREATVKVSVMIFKRTVFEGRRKPKGILRPKQRTNYKESQNLPWPHNATEHLLAEMFHGSAAQFLAITEALSSRSRRVLQTRPPFPPEHEIFDVTNELFLAGLLILSGGAGNTQLNAAACTDPIGGVTRTSPLIELAAAGEDGVSVEAAVRFAKTAFCYEHLEVFDIIIAPLLSFLRKNENLGWKNYELDLDLLIAMEPFISSRKPKHGLTVGGTCSIGGTLQPAGATILCDDLVILAEAMFAYTCTPPEGPTPDVDMIVDAVLFLWQKCKTVLQRGNFGVTGSTKYLKKLDNVGKWMHILSILQEVIIWCNLGDVDPVLMVDITLYSAGLLETLADASIKSKKKPGDIATRETQTDTATSSQTPAISMKTEHCTPTKVLVKHPAEQLDLACKMLEKALDSICTARSATVPTEKSLIDNSHIKVELRSFHSNIQPDEQEEDIPQKDSYKTTPLQSFIVDLHLELIQVYYRVAFKFLKMSNELLNSENTTIHETIKSDASYGFTILKEADIIKKVKKNNMLKAMFLIQKVMYLFSKEQDQSSKYQLLEKAATLLQKVETEEEILYSLRRKPTLTDNEELDVVPAPILLSRTHNSVIFKPAHFPSSKEVYWYRIFGRTATGSILKVRLKDSYLQGTGQEVPAFAECLLEVTGLEPNEKYIFAVAAYSKDGTIIGNGIGKTTKPILAYYSLPILTAWTYLCQVAYQLGHYPVSKAAFSILWKHFVTQGCLQQNNYLVTDKTDWCISQKSLNNVAVSLASPILLRSFLATIFIDSDISCQEDAVYCDSLSDNGPLYNGQLSRLAKCERILVAIKLASWINDVNQALQAVAQCYGLLAPLIFHRIPSVPVVQILIKCLCVLQHVIDVTKQRKQAGVTESLQHMTACITYYLAKILRFWKEYNLALEVVVIGKVILQSASQEISTELKTGGVEEEAEYIKNKWESTIEKQKLAIESSMQVMAMDNITSDLKREGTTEPLTGTEAAIYMTILYAPVNTAYSAVKKFKGKNRFLEYFVLLLERLVREEDYASITDLVKEVVGILRKRNSVLLGSRKTPGKKSAVKPLKNAVVVLEYHNNPSKKPKRDKATMKELLHNFINNPALKNDPNAQRKQRERLENKAMEVFQTMLGPIVRTYLHLKKFNKTCISEMPWRSQLNVLLGILCLNSFMKCYEKECWTSKSMSRYSFLDPDIFTLHNSGGLLLEAERDDTVTMHQIPEISLPSLKRNERSSESHGWDDGISDSSESIMNTPATQATTEESVPAAEGPSMPSRCSTSMFNQLNKAFLHFRRAVVLAHRGGHWTTLQNACRLLWNSAHTVMVYIASIDSLKSDTLTTDSVKNIFCLPFNLAAQNLIDMIVQLQNTNNDIKFADPDGIFSVPSCVGNISDDHGGFSLKFEQPFDNINVVDLNLVCAITLYAIELLCHQKKWESLAYLAMHFNAVTHERYAQTVTPLLVFAQGQLQQRIKASNGPVPPQPHFVTAEIDSGTVINSRNFIVTQLIVATPEDKADTIDLDRRNIHSGFQRANALVSVPVNVENTISTFRASLINVHFESTALRHSRKLLALLLAYTQQRRRDITKHIHGSVGFSATPVPMENAKPADLSNEDFGTFDDILCKPLPWSQVSLVILSYKHTIELLRINGQRSLCAQALHEQGNVHFYAGNKRAAIRCWCQAIDAILNMTDFIHNWQHLESSSSISLEHSKDYSEALLDRAGIWGCLQAGVLSAKIAQFMTPLDFSFRLDCCILSSFFFKALFRTTFPHPRSDLEYVSYEIGFDNDVTELIPGIDLFSDRFRADVRSVVGSLDFLLHELYSAQQNLKVLPLFTLYEYFASAVCRDVYRSVWGRILKIRVLADLGLFAEAFDEYSFLLNGKKLPHALLEGFRSRETGVHIKFDQSRVLLTENLMAVEYLLKIPLPHNLQMLYGPYLVNKFELGRTYLAIKLAATINHIPEKASFQCSTDSTNFDEDERIIDLDTDLVDIIPESDYAQETRGTCQRHKNELDVYSLSHTLTLPQLKDIILADVQKKLNILVDKLKKEHDLIFANLAPAQLEMVIDAKCQAAAVAFQNLQLAFSAAIALSAVQLLKRSRILINVKQSNVKPPSSALRSTPVESNSAEDQTNKNLYQDPYNMEARGRLNLNLWWKCRLVMVTALIAQVYGIRLSKGEDDFLETAQLCEDGMEEAKAYGDVETQTEFMLKAVLLDLQLGCHKARIKVLSEEIINLLSARQFLSPRAQMILAQAFLQLSDLRKSETLCNSKEAAMQEKINLCVSAQKLIFDQLVSLGESVQCPEDERIYPLPVLPLKNIYLSQLILMAKIKLRLGTASAQLITCSAERWNISCWQETLSCFTSALELCREAASKQIDLEADLLFQKGKILRQMTEMNYQKTLEAANFLMEAINVSYFHDQNLWLIRQSYLELVLLYFYLDEVEEKEAELGQESKATLKSGIIVVAKQPRRRVTGQGRLIEILQHVLRQPSKYKMLAWTAIRAANEIIRTLRNSQILTRDKKISEESIKHLVQKELPEFVILDILASYQDFETENDEFLPILTTIQGEKVEKEEQGTKHVAQNGTPNYVRSYRKVAQSLNSVQFLNYNNHLRRLYNINLLPIRSTAENVNGEGPDYPDPKIPFTEPSEAQMHEVDTDFLKCAIKDFGDGAHTPVFDTDLCPRLGLMHSFLKNYLPTYKNTCCAELIPIILYEIFDGTFTYSQFQPEIYTSVFGEYMLTTPMDSFVGQLTPQISVAVHSTDKELRVQWYLPALALPPPSCEAYKILLMFAYNVKPVTLVSLKTSTLTNASCGYKWIHLKRLLALHRKLSALKQKAEAYLQPEYALSTSLQYTHNRLKQKYIQNEPTTNVRKLPATLEDMVLQLCKEIKELFVPASETKTETEVPFDLSYDTLEQLEHIFNPAIGYTLKYGSLFKWLISFLEFE